VQIKTAPCFIIQRPQPVDVLAIEIQFSRALDAQHDRLAAHAFVRALPMRRQNAFPRDVRIAQETVGRARLAPAIARLRDTGRRVGRKSFHQFLRPPVQAGIAKVQPRKFLLDPLLRSLRHAPAQIARVDAIRSKFTSHPSSH